MVVISLKISSYVDLKGSSAGNCDSKDVHIKSKSVVQESVVEIITESMKFSSQSDQSCSYIVWSTWVMVCWGGFLRFLWILLWLKLLLRRFLRILSVSSELDSIHVIFLIHDVMRRDIFVIWCIGCLWRGLGRSIRCLEIGSARDIGSWSCSRKQTVDVQTNSHEEKFLGSAQVLFTSEVWYLKRMIKLNLLRSDDYQWVWEEEKK